MDPSARAVPAPRRCGKSAVRADVVGIAGALLGPSYAIRLHGRRYVRHARTSGTRPVTNNGGSRTLWKLRRTFLQLNGRTVKQSELTDRKEIVHFCRKK